MRGAAGPLDTVSASTLSTGLELVGLACGVDESDGVGMFGWMKVFSSLRLVDRAVAVFPERLFLARMLVNPPVLRGALFPLGGLEATAGLTGREAINVGARISVASDMSMEDSLKMMPLESADRGSASSM